MVTSSVITSLSEDCRRALDALIDSPRLPFVLDELNATLRDEMRRRGEFLDDLREEEKSEFINGEKIVQSPSRLSHTRAVGNLLTLLTIHCRRTGAGLVLSEKCLISLSRNDYEPDICFWRAAKATSFTNDQMRFPAPDLVVEVLSPSTEVRDRGVKFEDYAAHGIAEYWIVDPDAGTVEVFELREGRYELALKIGDGPVKSRVLEGLVLPARAIFDDEAHAQALVSGK